MHKKELLSLHLYIAGSKNITVKMSTIWQYNKGN